MISNKDSTPDGWERPLISALILAAGKGTRMKSNLAKVLHSVYFKPIVHYVLDCVSSLEVDNTILITGHQAEAVERSCSGYPVQFVRQEEQNGTGHAVLSAESKLNEYGGVVTILCGDTPLINPLSLQKMLDEHLKGGYILTVASTTLENPANYGRLITDNDNKVLSIVEEKDATSEQREIKLVNTGIYCVDCQFLFKSLKKVGTDNEQGEVYLTDVVSLANQEGYSVHNFNYPEPLEVMGINSRAELSQAHSFLQKKYLNSLMAQGVTVNLPDTVTIDPKSTIGEDTEINPNVYISGSTRIGRSCRIDPFSYINDSILGDKVSVKSGTYLEGVTIEEGESIGPGTYKK